MRIYLDTCALRRLTDAATQPRIHDEAIAVEDILSRCEEGTFRWVASTVLELEILQDDDDTRRDNALALMDRAAEMLTVGERVSAIADRLIAHGLDMMDAFHLAVCEHDQKIDALITVDDRFIQRSASFPDLVTKVVNPIEWLARQTKWLH